MAPNGPRHNSDLGGRLPLLSRISRSAGNWKGILRESASISWLKALSQKKGANQYHTAYNGRYVAAVIITEQLSLVLFLDCIGWGCCITEIMPNLVVCHIRMMWL